MKYDYKCPECKTIEERSVPLAQAEKQICGCGRPLERLFSPSSHVIIPEGFGENTASDFEPKTPEEKKTWDECGVGGTRWV